MNKVKTRFAPSPTGMMHIGSIRTALYAYILAKQNQGTFLLRIEDTDRERFVEGSAENIIETLKWLGLDWDEGPLYQSTRLNIYQDYAKQLVDKGLAYQDEGAIRFKTNKEGKTTWLDLTSKKEISIDNSLQEDFVIIKSDGYPTYNFAVVIDDYLMEVSHIIRGVEFISSTPKHIMLYQAFGWPLPQFVHLPLILGTDRAKLSKRHGAKPAWEYKQDGFLPEAILNYMTLLGWTPPEGKEILSLEEMTKLFNLADLNVNNPIFDVTKLEWVNGEYIRKTEDSKLKSLIYQYLQDLSANSLTKKDHPTEEEVEKLVPLVKERIKKLSDFIPLTYFIFEKPEYDLQVFQKVKVNDQDIKTVLGKIASDLEAMKKPWESSIFEETFRKIAEELGIKAGDIFQLIRITVSGQTVTPPLFETIKLIGEEETQNRVKWVEENYPDFKQ